MTLNEKKRKKKKHCDSVTYTTGDPMLNDYFFNKINGTDFIEDSSAEVPADNSNNGESTESFSEALTEAMNYSYIRDILNNIWNTHSGSTAAGVLATIDVSGGAESAIAKWAKTKVANLVHLNGQVEFNLDMEVFDDNGQSPGETQETLSDMLKKPKTVVLITDYLEAPVSMRNKYLRLFQRKNIKMIIVIGLAVDIKRIPAGDKAKFTNSVSFIDKDVVKQHEKAKVNNPVYDYAGAEPIGKVQENLTEAKREVRRYYIRPQNIFCANKAEIIKALIDIGDRTALYIL